MSHAGLPPTTSKGSGDANPVTTFNYEFPFFPITHVGTKATLGVLSPAGGGTGASSAFTQGSVIFAGPSGVYAQDNANLFWDNTNKRLGVGTASPSYAMDIQKTSTNLSGTEIGARDLFVVAPTANSTMAPTGRRIEVNSSTSFDISQLAALLTYANNNSTGTLSTLNAGQAQSFNNSTGAVTTSYGTRTESRNGSTGSIATSYGLFGSSTNLSTGSITTAYGVVGLVDNSSTGNVSTVVPIMGQFNGTGAGTHTAIYALRGSITSTGTSTNTYGVKIDLTNSGTMTTAHGLRVDTTNTGTMTNYYGLYLADPGSSSYFGIYSLGATKNYLAGTLGVGIAAPASKVHVDSGNATASAIKLTAGTTTGVTSTDGFEFGVDTSGNGEIRQRENLPINFFTNNTQRMTILANGNVGIGTAAPTVGLQVSNGDMASTARVRAGFGIGNQGAQLESNVQLATQSAAYLRQAAASATVPVAIIAGGATPTSTGHLLAWQDSAATTLGVIDFAGKLGLGNSAPGSALHVGAGSVATIPNGVGTTFTPQIQNSQTTGIAGISVGVNDGTNNRRAGIFVDQTNAAWGLSTSYSTGSIPFVINNAGTELIRITAAGSMGIGTNAPGSTLHVNGSYQGSVAALSTNTTLGITHQVVTADASGGAVTLTIPDCVAGIIGRTYRIKKIDSSANTVTLARTGSDDTFDGSTSLVISNQYQSVDIVCVSTTLWGIY